MKETLLIIAGAISAMGLFLHLVRGRRLIVAPMLEADFHPVPKHTMEFSWHWGAVTMGILTFCYLSPILREDFLPLAMLATVYGYWLGAISFLTMRRQKFRVIQMPQWVAFWAASACGLVSWGVL